MRDLQGEGKLEAGRDDKVLHGFLPHRFLFVATHSICLIQGHIESEVEAQWQK